MIAPPGGMSKSIDASLSDADGRSIVAGRWLGWRRRALVVLALLGCVGLFTLLRTLSGSPHYFCLRCDAERFQLYATGVIHCAQCGALMRNISVIEGEEGRAGSK